MPSYQVHLSDLLRVDFLDILVAEEDLDNRLAAVLDRSVVVVDVRRHKDLGVPDEALAGREVGDKSGGTVGVANVDDMCFLVEDSRAQKTWPATVHQIGRAHV